MAPAPFVHLHVHSHHSLNGGLASVSALMRRAAELEMPSLALTDHASLGGLVELFDAAARCGVKPIIGCDLPIRPTETKRAKAKSDRPAHARTSPQRGANAPQPTSPQPGGYPEITLLAMSDSGLRHLIALVNHAARRGAGNGGPHVTLEELTGQAEGLIALVGSARTELGRLVTAGQTDSIERHLATLIRGLGPDQLMLEVVRRGSPATDRLGDRIIEIADFLGLSAVASNDVWHLEPAHAMAHDFLRDVPCNMESWPAPERRRPPTGHFASPSEMRERFIHQPRLLENTLALAERASATIDLRRKRFPQLDFTRGQDTNSFLWDLVFQRAPDRLGPLTEEQKERLNAELNHIAEESLGNSLLILWKLAEALDAEGVLRGIGEGRITTSLVAHVLGLTEVNPMLHGLAFSGLLAEGESSPRLGLEVPARAMSAVEWHLSEICGATKVARVGASPTIQRRRLRRDLSQWAGIPNSQIPRLLANWPRRTVSLAEAQRDWEAATAGTLAVPRHLPAAVLAHLAQAIHPRRSAMGPLGGQVALSGEDLTQLLPLAPHPSTRLPLSQLDVASLDRFGLMRLEISAPNALDIVDRATEAVRLQDDADFHPEQIPFDDHETWVLIGRGDTTGIPGLERISTKSRLREAKPRSLAELLAVLQVGRPPAGGDEPALPRIAEAVLALRCAHLKAHHPIAFMAAMLTEHFADRRLLRVLLREATARGIRLLAPDINTSQFSFTQEDRVIRAGLMSVRRMTPEAYASIERTRLGGAFQDLPDLWTRVDHTAVPPALISNLIKGGVLDSLEADRPRMLSQLARINRPGPRVVPATSTLDLFELPADGEEARPEAIDEATLARYENQVLGTVLTDDPLTPHAEVIRRTRAVSPHALQSAEEGSEVTVVGFIDHGERCLLFDEGDGDHILDLEGQVVVVPEEVFTGVQECIQRGDPVLVAGTARRRGHERFVRAQCVMPLEQVERAAHAVSSIRLDLAGENRRTVKLLLALCHQYPGATKIEIATPPEGVSSRLCKRLAQARVFYAPPLRLGLRKILPERSIKVCKRTFAAENLSVA
jgi:DNA polymerase III alpha subunit